MIISIKEVKHLLPKELIEILENIFTSSQLDMIYKSYESGRNTSFRVNTLKGNTKDVMDELINSKIKAVNCPYIEKSFIVRGHKEKSLIKLNSYVDGKIYLQNLSSMLPPLFLELEEKQTILDICAAPGGKSSLMADITNNKATILANDVNEIRRQRMEYNAKKLGADSVIALGVDGRVIGKRLNKYFDRILLDAPCSGEGTIYLKKQRRYKGWRRKKVNECVKIQKKLIDSAYHALKSNGIMVYSTCTLNTFENEEVVDYILNKYDDLTIEKISLGINNECRGKTSYKDKKYNSKLSRALRIIPDENMEGFFIAKLRKINKAV